MNYDVVIPHFSGENNSDELRICVRSIQKNLARVNRIFVVGDIPDWLKKDGVPIPRYRRGFGCKFVDQQRKLLHCLKTQPLSENFVYTNDDVFIVQPTSVADIEQPFVESHFMDRAGEIWKSVFYQTLNYTAEKGGTSINYETHMPLVLNKTNAIQLLEDIGDNPVHIASAYFNLFPTEYRLPDKTIKRIRNNTDFGSAKIVNSCPLTFGKIKNKLQKQFNKKSDLENA